MLQAFPEMRVMEKDTERFPDHIKQANLLIREEARLFGADLKDCYRSISSEYRERDRSTHPSVSDHAVRATAWLVVVLDDTPTLRERLTGYALVADLDAVGGRMDLHERLSGSCVGHERALPVWMAQHRTVGADRFNQHF